MSVEEEEFEVAASYAARLSASAEEGRRLSFGAKITLDDFIKEGGQVDQMLAFAMPSSIPLYNPFKFCMDPDDPELAVAAQDNEDLIKEHVALSGDLHLSAGTILSNEMTKVSEAIKKMTDEEIRIFGC